MTLGLLCYAESLQLCKCANFDLLSSKLIVIMLGLLISQNYLNGYALTEHGVDRHAQ